VILAKSGVVDGRAAGIVLGAMAADGRPAS